MQDIRHARLQQLIDARFDGVQSAAAAAMGLSVTYMNDLVRERTPIGDRSAKRIERALGLEPGWLDRPRGSSKAVETLEVVVNGKVVLELPLGSAVSLRVRRR
jgi:hypothetical protein